MSAIASLSSLSDTAGMLESYDYLGYGSVVRRAHSQPNVDLSYVKRSGESSGDAGDQYAGLDRFGRVVDQRWLNPTSGTATDRFQYAYDLVSNRTSRDNLVNSAFGELYAYDDLSQLVSFQRGTLNGTKTGLTGSASRSQSWDTDAVGNFDSVTTDGTAQTRTANKQNEITSISGATTPTYDDNGNMTGDETGRQFVYDAWNRLVIVKNSGGTTLETFKYDGVNRRVSSNDGTTTTDLYYSSDWQVLSEKVGSNYTKRYVWSPVYVDAMVLRDRDTDSNGSLDERLWVQQDANFNVTALVNGSGVVVERYAYDAYGVRTVYDASYGTRSGSAYSFAHGFQGMFFDATSGLYGSRLRAGYSPTLGVWTQPDIIRFTAGDPNLSRFVGANPGNRTDPLGLFDPKDVYDDYLSPEEQAMLCELEKHGWRFKTERDTSQVIKTTFDAEVDHTYNKNVNVNVDNDKMIGLLIKGSDIQWRKDEWAVDFTKKQIWLDNFFDGAAAKRLKPIVRALHASGKAGNWKQYDVDLLSAKPVGSKTTIEGMKAWNRGVAPEGVEKLSITERRTLITLKTIGWNSSIDMVATIAGSNPAWIPGAGAFLKVLIKANKITGDLDTATKAQEALDKLGK